MIMVVEVKYVWLVCMNFLKYDKNEEKYLEQI